jgi:hypothetical protein
MGDFPADAMCEHTGWYPRVSNPGLALDLVLDLVISTMKYIFFSVDGCDILHHRKAG